jgi:hypothetical protein
MPSGSGTHKRVRNVMLVLLAGSILTATTAFAASLSVASKNLTVFRTCVVTATPSTSTADIDTYVDQNSATTNNGTATTMSVESGSGKNQRIYVKFDLTKCSPAIASTASVKSASLRLYVSTLPGACRTYDLFKVTSSWTETGITWNNQPFGTSINNPGTASRTSSLNVGTSPCQNSTAGAYVSGWDVTADVQTYVAGTSSNFGWMIRDDTEGTTPARTGTFSDRETNTLAQSPQLLINYST